MAPAHSQPHLGYTVRPPEASDAEAVNTLVRACELADEGGAEQTLDDLRGDWERPNFNLADDAWIISAADATIVAYANVWERLPGELYAADGYVHPRHRGRGLGSRLAALFESRATELAAGRPSTLQTIVFHPVEDARRLFESRGFAPNRYYWRMVIDMDSPPPEPALPDGITWRTFRDGDEHEVHAVIQETFADIENQVLSPFQEWQHFMMRGESFDPTLWFVAMDGDRIAGVLLSPSYPGFAWIRQVGVRREYRRRGIAHALLLTAFRELYARGERRVGLVVDSWNRTNAKAVYERAGMHLDRQHDQYAKVIGGPD
jgi:mycothiol synthase